MSTFGAFRNAMSGKNIVGSLPFIGANYWAGQNYAQQQQNLEWQQEAQRTTWAREDNAVQRRVSDLRAAGLSPVLAAGSAAQSGPVVSTQAPQRQSNGTGMMEVASQVMAMMRQKVDISRTEAETDAIMAQAEKTRTQTMIESERAKTIGSVISSQLGLTTANTSAARSAAALSRVEEEAKRYDYEGSRRTGTAVQASPFGRFYRDLFIDFIKPNRGYNRAGQTSNW